MTVQELIESLEELEELDVVTVEHNGRCGRYEGEDIEFIDETILNSIVQHYEVHDKNERFDYRSVYITY